MSWVAVLVALRRAVGTDDQLPQWRAWVVWSQSVEELRRADRSRQSLCPASSRSGSPLGLLYQDVSPCLREAR